MRFERSNRSPVDAAAATPRGTTCSRAWSNAAATAIATRIAMSCWRGMGGALAVVGAFIVLTGCSSVSVQPPERDRSMELRGSERGRRVADIAMRYRGAPYRWGGAGPSGFDCSGFVRYVYAQVGVSLPHNAAMQYEHGTPIPRDRLQPGDLVFFDRLRHNGIYIGEGRFIHSRQTGKRVGVATLDQDWYRSRWVGARRP
jgi:cell wall-associated NlpC family hydrolase